MAHLSIDVLGSLRVSIADTPIKTLESDKVRALLAYLAVESEHSHRRDTLVGLLWPDYSEETARHNLRQALFNLRLMLGDHQADPPYLIITRDAIQFNRQCDYSLDLDQFNQYFYTCEENLSQCKEDCSIHASRLEEMVKLYRGEFLQHLTVNDSNEFEEWALVQREGIHQRIIEAHTYLANYYDLQADFQSARRHAARQLELDPWREEAHRQMMRVLALDGQRTAALAQYETCKKVLSEELDVEPSAETRELYEQIKLDRLSLNPDQLSRVPTRPVNNLQIQPTPFVGRESELDQLGTLLADPECRCITLVGPGGIGKTRLAVQAAGQFIDNFTHGAAFVALAPVGSIVGVVPAIAKAINFSFYDTCDPRIELINFLSGKQMLLILDNVEHLLNEDAQHENITQLMQDILQSCPGVKLLVTTREALNMQWEYIFEVQGLAYPVADLTEGLEGFDAITLFAQRARRAFPRFVLNSNNRADVAHICRLVEGMPLAIELAATWMRVLSPPEIANEIEKSMDFLSSTFRDLPERHRSMRVVFDYSWQMLSTDEQQVLCKLSVFRGGFQREAAEQVGGANLSILSTLVNRTMLHRTATGRYDLHELVRQYCASRLDSDPQLKAAVRSQHYAFFLTLAETAGQGLMGRNQMEWLIRLEQEHDNLQAALDWALEEQDAQQNGDELALRLVGSLRWYWRMRGHLHEGCNCITEALGRYPEKHTINRASALLAMSVLMNSMGDLCASLSLAEESAAIYKELGEMQSMAEALVISGLTLFWQGEATLGRARMREALEIFRNYGNRWGEAQALFRLGWNLADYGGDPAGRLMLEESAAILENVDEKYLYTSVLISLGIVELSLGDYAAARSHFESGLATAREIRHPLGIADALTNLGCLLRIQGEYATAQSHFDESLLVYHDIGYNKWQIDVHCAIAENDMAQGDCATARQHLKAASYLLESSDNKWLQVLVLYFQGVLSFYENDNGEAVKLLAETVQLARQGQFMPDLARSLVSLGCAERRLGEICTADELIREGLALFMGFKHKLGMVKALEALAYVRAAQGDDHQVVKMIATASRLRQELGAPLPPIDHPAFDSTLAATRSRLGEPLFTELWAATEAESLDDVVKVVLNPEDAD